MDDERLSAAAQQFAETFASLVAWLLTWWSEGRDPGLHSMRGALQAMWPVVSWSTAGVTAVALVVLGATLTLRRRGEDLAGALLGIGRLLLVISAGWLVLASAWTLSDGLARWILGGSLPSGQVRERLVAAGADVQPLLALVLSVSGIVAALVFLTVVVARFLMVAVLMAALPVAAGLSVAGTGAVFARAGTWLVAALAFRPLASLICRFGLILNQRVDEALLVLLTMIVMLLAAAAALPLTARLLDGART